MEKQSLTSLLKITHPIIIAPMFLVSNTKMVIEGMKSGVAGCIPALNYRTLEELRSAIIELRNAKVAGGSFGFNLIVNKSNVKYKEQLRILCEEKVDFILTSLGSPEETINEAHKAGIKVFCDVTDLNFAKKVESLGADALVAVNNQAGGHRGNINPEELIKQLDDAGAKRFGSGWAWLVVKADGSLAVTSTSNQDNPLMPEAEVAGTPILGIDVWEHAYYLKYQNKRDEYLKAFTNVLDWKEVEENYKKAK